MSIEQMAQDYAEAWSSGDPDSVVSFYCDDGEIIINRDDMVSGRAALLDMVSGFYKEFPGMSVALDHLRVGDDHVIFGWILEGTHAETPNRVKVLGCEEWNLDETQKVTRSLGWLDAEEFEPQIREGI